MAVGAATIGRIGINVIISRCGSLTARTPLGLRGGAQRSFVTETEEPTYPRAYSNRD